MIWKLFSIRAKVAQLLLVADCERFGCAEKTILADILFPVHLRAMYFIRSIAITTRTTDLKRNRVKSCEWQALTNYYLKDFRFLESVLKRGS